MRRILSICVSTLILAAAACGGGAAALGGFPVGDMTDEETLRKMDEEGEKLWDQGDWEATYQLLEPDYREACSYERFARMSDLGSALDSILKSDERDGEIVDIEINGDRATVTYLDYSPARDELDEETSEAVKIEGHWFIASDPEGIDACDSDMFANDEAAEASISAFELGLYLPGALDSSSRREALFEERLSERFKGACPYEAFNRSLPEIAAQFRTTFADPFAWEFQTAPEYVQITAAGEPVANAALEGESWKVDSVAGHEECP
jgi:hypothetical protein